MRRHAGIALVAGLVFTCAATADAFVFWANRDSGTIGRAKSNGKGVDQNYIKARSSVFGVAVDEDYVYWSDRKKGRIGRASRDSGDIDRKFVVVGGSPHGIAIDSHYIYWADTATNSIGRAALDGTDVNPSFITGSNGGGVAVDAHNIYWTSSAGIGRANLDGTSVDQAFVSTLAYGVAVDARHIFWAYFRYSPNRGGVGRANVNGSEVKGKFVSVRNIYPHDVAVDDAHVWWVEQGGIGRSSLSGRKVKPGFIRGPRVGHGETGIADMAADADGTPPSTTIKQHPPARTRSRTVRFEFRSSERGSKFKCKLDKHRWRGCDASYAIEDLDPGDHQLQVRATDRFGNTDPTPAKDRFQIV